MALGRNGWKLLLLGPLAFLGVAGGARDARAADPFIGPLPNKVHQLPSGRFYRDFCDHSPTRTSEFYCMSSILLPESWTPGQPVPPIAQKGGGTTTGMAPTDVLTGYSIPSSTSAGGKIVAILDSPDSNAYSDLTAYRTKFALPALPQCSGLPNGSTPCFAQVNETGGASTGDDGGEDADGETSLDMDMISAACPDCAILLVEIGTTQGIANSDILTGVQTATTLHASATSISLGSPEAKGDATGFTTPGRNLVMAASGDQGYLMQTAQGGGKSPSYPSSATDILAIGGTNLFAKTGGTYDEAVWNNAEGATTSGCSTLFATPTWQAAGLASSGCAKRATTDIAAAADFTATSGSDVGIEIVLEGSATDGVFGTSAASPLVAAILTRLNLTTTISNDLGWVYTNAAAFNDLGSSAYPADTAGSSTDNTEGTSSCGVLCTVGTGWDGPSGIGTPNGTKLAALAGGTTPPPVTGDDAGPTASGSSGGTTSSSGGATSSSGGATSSSGGAGGSSGGVGVGSSGGSFYSDDAGPAFGEDGGAPLTSASSDGGANDEFPSGGSSTAGCGCTTPGTTSGGEGAGLLVLGLAILVGGRSRRRQG